MRDILHGVILLKSLKSDFELEKKFKMVGSIGENIKVVRVNTIDLKNKINLLREALIDINWYAHFYDNNDKLIVVFKEKTFYILKAKDTWRNMLEYAKSIGIPEEQMDIYPLYFKDEDIKID